jgi:hypothetical protein
MEIAPTLRSLLTAPLKLIRERGGKYFIKDGCKFCSTCKAAGLPSDCKNRHIFWRVEEENGVAFLYWRGDGNLIVSALEAFGLAVLWDGVYGNEIRVYNTQEVVSQ